MTYTKEMKAQAFEMRQTGASWQQIADTIGGTKQGIRAALQSVLNDTRHREMIYPEIAKELNARGWTQNTLAEKTCFNAATISQVLRGRREPTPKLIRAVVLTFRKPAELLFRREETQA